MKKIEENAYININKLLDYYKTINKKVNKKNLINS